MTAARKLTRKALQARPLPAVVDGDKESKGRILVVAGSREVPGASLLTATAAMRAGAGKLRIATGASAAPMLGAAMPEAAVVALPERRDGSLATEAVRVVGREAGSADVVVAGPGLPGGRACGAIASSLVASEAALVLDAALLYELEPTRAERPSVPILLPHRKEMAALLDCDEREIERDPLACGRQAAERYRSHVLVKGVTSHVVAIDGEAWKFEGGVPGLGVSGSGDVLAGLVGGLLTRGADPLDALLWGVLLHGEAGEALARKVGAIGFLAREIASEIPSLMLR